MATFKRASMEGKKMKQFLINKIPQIPEIENFSISFKSHERILKFLGFLSNVAFFFSSRKLRKSKLFLPLRLLDWVAWNEDYNIPYLISFHDKKLNNPKLSTRINCFLNFFWEGKVFCMFNQPILFQFS